MSIELARMDNPPMVLGVTPRKVTVNCSWCGRFCRMHSSLEYDGNGTQLYVTFFCKKCGEHTEAMW